MATFKTTIPHARDIRRALHVKLAAEREAYLECQRVTVTNKLQQACKVGDCIMTAQLPADLDPIILAELKNAGYTIKPGIFLNSTTAEF